MPISTDQLARLQELAALQQETHTAMLALLGAGSRPSDEAYETYLAVARRLVVRVASFEAESPGGFDVSWPSAGTSVEVEFAAKEPGVYRLQIEGREAETVTDLVVVAPA